MADTVSGSVNQVLADVAAAYTKLETTIAAVSDALTVMVQTTGKILTVAEPLGQQLADIKARVASVRAAIPDLTNLHDRVIAAHQAEAGVLARQTEAEAAAVAAEQRVADAEQRLETIRQSFRDVSAAIGRKN